MNKLNGMQGKRVLCAVLVSIAAFFSASSNAVPVVWYLSGFTFVDGGTASGSFTYDADINTYSAINISTTAGSVITSPNSYDFAQAGIGCDAADTHCLLNSADGPDYTGDMGFTLGHTGSPLTNAGGTIALTGAREYTCENAACSSVGSPLRLMATGSVTTSEPELTYSVGGTVSGVDCGGPPGCLWLENNGGDELYPDNGSFTFGTELADGGGYSVTVAGKPGDQTCTVTNGSGTIDAANVTDVSVTCVDDPVVPPEPEPPAPPAPPEVIPTMSAYGLILTMLGLMFVAVRRLRASAKRD